MIRYKYIMLFNISI